jgi:signal transduction histidine kinase
MNNSKGNVFKLLFFLLSIQYLFSQNQERIFNDSVKAKINFYSSEINFKKASEYFIVKNWDSTLVFTQKQLHENFNSEINNYCHYYRGISFQQKKIFNQAEKEFQNISKTFDFYYLGRMVLGEIALEQSQFQKAKNYFKVIETLDAKKDIHIDRSSVINNLGICYLHLQEFDKAESYLLESNAFYVKEKDTLKLISSYSDIANLYYEQYKDELAIPYFLKAYDLSKLLDKRYSLKSIAARNMSIVEENRKDYVKALTYRKEFEQWNDSLNNQIKIWETAEREKQDAITLKQQEVAILEADNKVKIAQRNGYLYASITLLILLGTGFYLYREKVKANKTIAAQKEALDELNATKDYLFSVVSHDLRSPVNALRKQHQKLKRQLQQNDLEKLSETVATSTNISESMHGLLNNILHWSLEQNNQLLFQKETIALQPIVNQVLFDFKNLAAAKHISITTDIESEIIANFDRESLKIVLRNLLDNAIKYTNQHGKIHIKATENPTHTQLQISDTGIGFSPEHIQKINHLTTITTEKIDRSQGVGLGLLLCVTLIRKNKGIFTVESQKSQGSVIAISLPKT